MPFYRIDNRKYEVGDIIPPQSEFIKRVDKKRLQVEELLMQSKPNDKPDRNTILKVFDSFDAAKKFWITTSNSIFYEVSIDENDIQHRGDYNLIEKIDKIEDESERLVFAKQYWVGTNDQSVIIEYFVSYAKVVRIISADENERENTKRSHYGFPTNPNIRIIK